MSDRKIWHCGPPGQEGAAHVKCFSSSEAVRMAEWLAGQDEGLMKKRAAGKPPNSGRWLKPD